MKKLLNMLFVTTQGAYLNQEGETVVVSVGGEVKLRIPAHLLEGIVCFGNVYCSHPLMGFCAERNIGISFLTEHGRFLARVHGPVSGNVLLRREQYRRADNPRATVSLAKSFVLGKIANCRTVLKRALRDHSDTLPASELESRILRLSALLKEVEDAETVEHVRAREGEAASLYFSVFSHLITLPNSGFTFAGRSRRPPMDNVNALLSFLYTLVVHDAVSQLESVGLDPQVGYLHALRPGRPALALDLVEEFRPFLADRLALSLINLQQIRAKGFEKTESGAVIMDEETRRTVLRAYQKRKQEVLRHPFIEEEVPLGLLLHVQALLLARHLRGDLDAYPPFIWR